MGVLANQVIKIKRHKNILSNLSYLSVLQLFNLFLPIITYPYLIKTLGKEIYGQVIFVQAAVGYLVILINFGFNITATKEISIHRNNKVKLNKIINSVYQLQGLLFLVSVIVVLLYLFIAKASSNTYYLYLLFMWMPLNEFLFPVWYFQGTEKMKYITILTMVSRITFLILIFILIRSPADYLKVPLINGLGAMISCAIAIRILYKNNFRFQLQKKIALTHYLKKSYLMAIALGANTFKTNFNIIVAKIFFSYSVVAYFDLALKITNIGISFLDLISQAIYPKMSQFKDTVFLKKILKLSFLLALGFMLFIQIFSGKLVHILGGNSMKDAVNLLIILATVLPVYIVGALLGRNCLIIFGHDLLVLKSMLFSSVIYLVAFIAFRLFVKDMSSNWVAVFYVISFLFESLYRYYKCKKLKLI